MTEEEIQKRMNKLLAMATRNNWTLTEADAGEYVVLEAKADRTEAESARKREIMLRAMGRKECTCGHCHGHAGEECKGNGPY